MSLVKQKRGEPDEALGARGVGGRTGGIGGLGGEGGGGGRENNNLRTSSVKQRTAHDCRRLRRSSRKSVASLALVIAGLLNGTRGVLGADYVDGGEVSMSCDNCGCTGSSDDGDITVFDSPSSGERVRARSARYC